MVSMYAGYQYIVHILIRRSLLVTKTAITHCYELSLAVTAVIFLFLSYTLSKVVF